MIDILKDMPTEDEQIEALLPYARELAAKFFRKTPPCVMFDDLFLEAQYGLLQAVRKYDPGRNETFKGYAYLRIRGAMLDWLRTKDRTWNRYKGQIAHVYSLDYEYEDEELKDRLECTGPQPGDAIESKDEIEYLLAKMPPIYRQLYLYRYVDGFTCLELGKWLGLSESRISQLFINSQKVFEGQHNGFSKIIPKKSVPKKVDCKVEVARRQRIAHNQLSVIKKDRKAGVSVRILAERYRVTRYTIYRALKRAG